MPALLNFDIEFDRLIGSEGGYVNRADDPGGETNWGITWPILRQAIALGIVPQSTTIASLTRDQSKLIYKPLFWEHVGGEKLPPAVVFQLFDFAVNSGIETAIRKYQRALGVADDGHFGAASAAAAATMTTTDQLFRLFAERLDFMRSLSNWSAAGKGWAGRIANDLRFAAQDA